MTGRGVVYLAVNHQNYLEAALISAVALRRQEPTLPITIISNLPALSYLSLDQYGITLQGLGESTTAQGLAVSRSLKTQINHYSPYRETLFLDADILPIRSIAGLWSYLGQGDVAMAEDRLPQIHLCDHVAREEIEFTLKILPHHTAHFNSGVFLWRRTAGTDNLFSHWHREWQRFQQQDQLALARAIGSTQTAVVKIPRSYNISPRDAEPLLKRGEEIHLLHCWGGKVSDGRFKKLARRFCAEAVTAVEILWSEAAGLDP
jgi:hypothetical protein